MPIFDPASAQGHSLSNVWQIFIAGALFVAFFVWALIGYAIVKWRARPGDFGWGEQFSNNKFWEITGVVIPILMVAGLFGITLVREYPIDAVNDRPYAVVDVTAFRWSWQFRYPGHSIAIDGTADSPPQLVLPQGKLTQINLYSSDVVHSFWIPAFLFKRDATPGYTMHFDVTPSKAGVFEGKCVEFCGLDHARMTFTVRVVPAPAYDRWLASNGTAPV